MTIREKAITVYRIFGLFGLKGVIKVFQKERFFYKAVLDGKLGYALFTGEKKSTWKNLKEPIIPYALEEVSNLDINGFRLTFVHDE